MAEPYKIVYSYNDVPTIKKFAQSNKRIKGLLGPFASGKSSGCLMEIIRRAHEQAPSQDGIRRTRWAIIRNCFDDQTEVLTEKRGWQLFKDLVPEDKIASQEKGNELVFVTPSFYYSSPYKGEMIGYENRNIDFLVTPDHRLYASMINGRTKKMYGYEFYKAGDIYGMTHYRFKKNIEKYNGGFSEFSERMFEFFGFWFAEGYVGKYPRKDTHGYHWRLTVSQKENIKYVTELLDACGFKYGRNKNTNSSAYNYCVYVNDDIKLLIEKLLPCGNSRTKHLPDWIKNAPSSHLQAFLRGYEKGDGHTRTHKNDSTRLYTSSEKLANDLQEIILRSGGSASLNRYIAKRRIGSFLSQGFYFILTVHQANQYLPQTSRKNNWYKQQYDGLVYCVEVPSHVVVTRRNYVISLSSQTYAQLKDTTIRTVMDWLPETVFGEYSVTNHIYTITKFPGVHIELLFRALDRPEQVANLLSLELTGAWVNEAREIPWAIIDALDGRINRYPGKKDGGCTWCGIIMDTNPPDENSEWFKFFEVNKPITAAIFKQPSGLSNKAENLKNLAKNYYKDLAIGKSPQYVRVYIEGQYGYTSEGKLVIEQFNDNTHIALSVIQPLKTQPLICGFDFGLNPTLILAQITPRGRLLIIDELVSDGMDLEIFLNTIAIPQMRMKYFGIAIQGGYGDPSGSSRAPTDSSTCFEVLRNNGFRLVRPCPTNALLPRVAAVQGFLTRMIDGEPAIVISPACVMLRKALNGGYHRKKIPGTINEYSDEPFKNIFSHPAEALQYLCYYVNDLRKRTERSDKLLGQTGLKSRGPVSSETGML
jgi:hypothetical protein